MCWKRIKSFFVGKDVEILDANQKQYREKFGIVDKYLLQYSIEEKDGHDNSYIIFIDYQNSIDWIDNRDKSFWTEEDTSNYNDYLARLELIQSRPIFNLSKNEKLAYKIMLGAAYIQVFNRQFKNVDNMIAEAQMFFVKRNSENARKYCLNYSGLIVLLCILFMLYTYFSHIVDANTFSWLFAVSMGVLGAYVSIWGRYTKYDLEGVSSKVLYVLESCSRMLIGVIFAFVALLAIKCGIAFSFINSEIEVYAYGLCGFASGMSERFIPSLVERITNDEKQKSEV